MGTKTCLHQGQGFRILPTLWGHVAIT